MSISRCVNVFVGVKFEEIFKTERILTNVTRYDEITGKPYIKKSYYNKTTLIDDSSIDLETTLYELCEKKDLEILETKFGINYIGTLIETTDDIIEINPDFNYNKVIEEVKIKLNEFEYKETPKLFLLYHED